MRHLAVTSIGHLGQTSKDMRNILIRWTGTSRMQYRLMQTVLRTRLTSQKTWNGKLSLPSELHIECQRTGVLLKLLTCLFPTSQRLGLYYQLITEVYLPLNKEIMKTFHNNETVVIFLLNNKR